MTDVAGFHQDRVVMLAGVRQDLSTNRLAMASLFFGLVGNCGIGSILAIGLGRTAQRQIDESGGVQPGRAMATTGIVLACIQLVFILGLLLLHAASQV